MQFIENIPLYCYNLRMPPEQVYPRRFNEATYSLTQRELAYRSGIMLKRLTDALTDPRSNPGAAKAAAEALLRGSKSFEFSAPDRKGVYHQVKHGQKKRRKRFFGGIKSRWMKIDVHQEPGLFSYGRVSEVTLSANYDRFGQPTKGTVQVRSTEGKTFENSEEAYEEARKILSNIL